MHKWIAWVPYIVIGLMVVVCVLYWYSRSRRREAFTDRQHPKVYVIITTCLLEENYDLRKSQYMKGIESMLDSIKGRNFIPLIVENNSKQNKTFLDDFGIPVLYTRNNDPEKCRINRTFIGDIENKDVQECIKKFGISDDDFIVKFTGRYIVEPHSEFMATLFDMMDTDPYKYDTIVKYGNYDSPQNHRMNEVVTGLIGMRTKYVKQITFNNRSIEHDWAEISMKIPDEKVYIPDALGVQMCPGKVDGFFRI